MSADTPDEAASAPSRAAPEAPALSPMPIIVGVPRSGTTMLRLMLDAHSLVAIPPETYFVLRVIQAQRAGERLTSDQLFKLVTTIPVWDDFRVSREAYFECLQNIEPFTASDGLRAFYQTYAQRFGKPRWGDKTPKYSRFMLSIERLLPEARFIHVIRDGRDVALSLRTTWFAPGQDMATLAQSWKQRIESARKIAGSCTHYMEVRYEDLVHQTRDVLVNVCDFIDLPFEDTMERYYRSAEHRLGELNPHYNPDGSIRVARERRLRIHEYSTQPPTPTRVGRWRYEMSLEERLVFDRVAGELLHQLGYTT